jgi:ABC-type phosphate transport system substrate-binding protein
MRVNLTRSLLRTSCLATTAFVGLAAPAMANDIILGGGSTLAEPIYNELFSLDNGVTFQYCGVGSGKGQAGLLGNDPTQYVETTLKTGDSAICTSLTAKNKPVVFGASDATLSTTQISTYNTSRLSTDGPLIQVPTLGTPITVPVATAKVTSNTYVTLKDNDLCGIYAGQFTNWSQTSVAGTVLSGPIHVVYRSDGSGTTFLLTQHLHAVCGTSSNPQGAVFAGSGAPTTSFASLFPSGFPAGSTFVGAAGSQGVQTTLLTNISSTASTLVGYLSPDYTAITTTPPTSNTKLFVAEVFNSISKVAVQPTAKQTGNALATANATIPATKAAAAAQANWVPAVPNPSTGYPVVGYTTIDSPTCYASNIPAPQTATSPGADISGFLGGIFTNPTYASDITAYGFVNLPSALAAAANATFVKNTTYVANGSTVGPWALNINNSTVCAGKGRSASN